MATEGQALENAEKIIESTKRAADDLEGSKPAPILIGHYGESVSAGHPFEKPSCSDGSDGAKIAAERWRMDHPSISDGDDEPKQ